MIGLRRFLARVLEALHLEVLLVPADLVLRRLRLGPRIALPVLVLATAALVASLPDALAAGLLGSYRQGVVLALTVVGGWGTAAAVQRLRSDVASLLGAVYAIAMNDLGARDLPSGKDELAEMGSALDMTREQLLFNLMELTRAQSEREEQVQASFVQHRAAEAQSRERAQAAIDDTATTIVRELDEIVERMTAVNRVTAVIDGKVSTADTATRAVVAETQEADRLVSALSHSLSRVAAVAQLISGIADQTRLLALNATIESARAGEAGRGFSVVAQEVKNLATSTAQSTGEITSTIASLQEDAGAVAEAITRMAQGVGGVDEATAVLTDVAREQHDLVQALSRSLSETIDRVQHMGDLTRSLERRKYVRIPTEGSLIYVHRGGEHEARLADLSEGGLRCTVPAVEGPSDGDEIEICVQLVDGPLQLAARVVRRAVSGDTAELGMEFVEVHQAAAERLGAHLDRFAIA